MKQQTRMRMYPCTATMLLTLLYEAWAFVGRKMPTKAVADWEHLFCRLQSWWEMMRQTELVWAAWVVTEEHGGCSLETRMGSWCKPNGKFYVELTLLRMIHANVSTLLLLSSLADACFLEASGPSFKHCFPWIVETNLSFFCESAVTCLFPLQGLLIFQTPLTKRP